MIQKNTIYGLSTLYGKSAIAIIKISGPKSLKVLKSLNFKNKLIERKAILGKVYTKNLDLLDEIIVIYFCKNNSYTGEDVVELQTHGGIAIVNSIFNELRSLNYLRVANNGEFTKVALENNKITLNKAESLIELINAETECQRKVSVRNYNGNLEESYSLWRSSMIKLLSISEAYIDFPDYLISNIILQKLNLRIRQLRDEFENNIKLFAFANKLMNGVNLCIAGPTNVGKSTLMNFLSQSDASIISNIQGTTRDIIKSKLDILGVPVILHDTAGIRNTSDYIENIGIKKGKEAIKNADILIIMLEASSAIDFSILAQFKSYRKPDSKVLILINKVDLFKEFQSLKIYLNLYLSKINFKFEKILLSCLNKNHSKKKILNFIKKLIENFIPISGATLVTNVRHQEKLKKSAYYLNEAANNKALELKAQELRYAAEEIGFILGDINFEEVLNKIFSTFCVGK